MQFVLQCCAIEMMAALTIFNIMRILVLIPRATPRQVDVMFVAGTVTMQIWRLVIKRLYDQMPERDYIISMEVVPIAAGHIGRHGYHESKSVIVSFAG